MDPVLQVLRLETAGGMQWRLARGELLVLRDARACSLRCAEGSLWLSESDGRDEILLPGAVYRIARQGDTVISAGRDASFSITPARMRHWRARLRALAAIAWPCGSEA